MHPLDPVGPALRRLALIGAARAFEAGVRHVYEELTGERAPRSATAAVRSLQEAALLRPEAALHLGAMHDALFAVIKPRIRVLPPHLLETGRRSGSAKTHD